MGAVSSYKAVETPCPEEGCGNDWLKLTLELNAKELGKYSIAGAQMKVVVEVQPCLTCPACGWYKWGRVQGGDAVFTREEWE